MAARPFDDDRTDTRDEARTDTRDGRGAPA